VWVLFKKVDSQIVAEMWKDALESEGLPCRMLPEEEISKWSETGSFVLYVPKGREHVGEEIVRKL
jgi:hypothetical protein